PPDPSRLLSLSLHDALPICDDAAVGRHDSRLRRAAAIGGSVGPPVDAWRVLRGDVPVHCDRLRVSLLSAGARAALVHGVSLFSRDRKSTRLNSSHEWISYAV